MAIYIELCYYANYITGQCYPSIETIAENLHISKRHIIRILKELTEKGYINKEKKDYCHNIYTILKSNENAGFDTGDTREPGTGDTSDKKTGDTTAPVNIISNTKENKEISAQEPRGCPPGSYGRLKASFIAKYTAWFKTPPKLTKGDAFSLQWLIREYGEAPVDELITPFFENEIKDTFREKLAYSPVALKSALIKYYFNENRKDKANAGGTR